jgi:predicted aldo/keto reductase-like oxidoreductase
MASIFPESKLGFGCMRLPLLDPADESSIDIEHFKRMVDAFMQGGNTYFDTAYVYHQGQSEVAVRKALVERYPRESFTIATKCLAWAQPTAEAAKACFDTSLERLGVDYVDYYLLHNVGGKRTAKFDEWDLWNYFGQLKAQGKIKYLGFSIHDGANVLDEILTAHPEMDFVQLQVNYLDWDDPVTESRRLMEVAKRHGKPVIITEPARGGRLCDLPESVAQILAEANPNASQANWAYRFCWNLPNTVCTLAGMSTLEQVEENVASYAANKPFTDEESAALDRAVAALREMQVVACTNCRYCVKDCPQHVKIPEVMGLLNLEAMTSNHDFVKGLYSWQTAEGRASACIQCGMCEDMCPQKIDIIHQLEVAAEKYE